jgi:hypothetical protein
MVIIIFILTSLEKVRNGQEDSKSDTLASDKVGSLSKVWGR